MSSPSLRIATWVRRSLMMCCTAHGPQCQSDFLLCCCLCVFSVLPLPLPLLSLSLVALVHCRTTTSHLLHVYCVLPHCLQAYYGDALPPAAVEVLAEGRGLAEARAALEAAFRQVRVWVPVSGRWAGAEAGSIATCVCSSSGAAMLAYVIGRLLQVQEVSCSGGNYCLTGGSK